MSAAAPALSEIYRPRPVEALGRRQAGGATVKTYGMRAGDAPLDPALVEAAFRFLDDVGPEERSIGFAILHRGEEAVWLLLHWWMAGGILTERLWRRPLDGGTFEPVGRPLMACVWELAVIGFERDAYVATVMAGGSDEDYLASVRPDGDC